MGSTRRRFTDEYKQHAVRLVLDSGDRFAEIGRSRSPVADGNAPTGSSTSWRVEADRNAPCTIAFIRPPQFDGVSGPRTS